MCNLYFLLFQVYFVVGLDVHTVGLFTALNFSTLGRKHHEFKGLPKGFRLSRGFPTFHSTKSVKEVMSNR